MKFTWFENNSFLIDSAYPQKILLNPSSNVLSTLNSSSNFLILYPSKNFEVLPTTLLNNAVVLDPTKSFSDENISITAYSSFMDNINGLKRGENFIYSIILNSIKIVHLGFLGCIPDSSILQAIANPDILFIPIGGNLCLDAISAKKLINLLSPKFTIPMNYKYEQNLFYYDGLHKFITTQKEVIKLSTSTLHYQDLDKFPLHSTLILTPKTKNNQGIALTP